MTVDKPHRISRRDMLHLLGVGGVVLATRGSAVLHAQSLPVPPQASDLDGWLQSELVSADLSGIAAAWRGRHPLENSPDLLARRVLAARGKHEQLGTYLQRVIASEYKEGKAELLDGWYLSPTEGRLATLVSGNKG